jgi:macrolide-specific efflux system membrane fusion protein
MSLGTRKQKVYVGGIILILAGSALIYNNYSKPKQNWQSVKAEAASFKVSISSTGSIVPENKIDLMAPVAGRIEKIMVEEGSDVRKGQILTWMSSQDRAALLDAARAQGEANYKEWLETYKPTPILSPTNGQIIKRKIVVGQTVSNSTELFEISDRLIVKALVDETDIGRIRVGQPTELHIDAFPDKVLNAKVKRIGHQSILENNINNYEVFMDITENFPDLRSGMTVSVDFLLFEKPGAVVIPSFLASGKENSKVDIFVKDIENNPVKRTIQVGMSNGQKIEVLANLKPQEEVMYQSLELTEAKAPLGLFQAKKKKN